MENKGVIVNYHIAYTKEVLVKMPNMDKKTANRLIGKKAVWKDQKGTVYTGKVTGTHGTGSTVKVRFKSRLPPTCLAKPIHIQNN